MINGKADAEASRAPSGDGGGPRDGVLGRLLQSPLAVAFASGMLFSGVLTALYFPIHELGFAPNPTFDFVDLLINYSPGAMATWAIETFGHMGKVLLTTGGVAAWMLIGGVLAAAGVRLAGPDAEVGRAGLFAGIPQAAAVMVIELAGGGSEGGLLGLVFLVAASLGWGYVVIWAPRKARAAIQGGGARGARFAPERPLTRRALLASSATVVAWAAAGAGGSMLAWWSVRSYKGAQTTATAAAKPGELILPNFDLNFSPAAGTRALVTTNEDFYKVDIMTRTPQINADLWLLKVHGLVRKELKLSYPDLLGLEALEQYATLQCVSNEVGGELISTTRWKGVPLRRVLEMAEPQAGAVDVVFRAEGGYHDSIPIAKAMEPTTLLAYSMNGVPLPNEHGYPVRAYIPNIYGMKNVKWIHDIEVVQEDHQGYWQLRGWSDLAVVKTTSAIDLPGSTVRFTKGENAIGGIAFAGNRGISAVEFRLSKDGVWTPAELEKPLSKLTWRRWKGTLDLPPGRHLLQVRAVDGAGNPQEEADTASHPAGAGGYHEVRITAEP